MSNTKVIILGEEPIKEEKKKIEFKYKVVDKIGQTKMTNIFNHPHEWANIELICRAEDGHFDIMFAYDHDRGMGNIYLGHFNDGVV